MEKKKLVYDAPSTQEILFKTEHFFMQSQPSGSGGDDVVVDDGQW